MTANRQEKNNAKDVATYLDLRYTHALRLVREARKDQPLTGRALRERCRELLSAEGTNAR